MSDGNKKPIIIIILVIAIAAIAGAATYFLLYNKPAGQEKEVKYVEKELVEKTMSLEEFTVNLADEGGKSFIQTKLTIAYPDKNKDLEAEITEKVNKIQDIINSTLRQKKADDFNGQGLEAVKKEMLDKINDGLTSGRITSIYVNKIVIQK